MTGSYEGQTLDRWYMEKLIGRGGMGSVYKAFRTDGTVTQPVALKISHRTYQGDAFDEAEALRRVNHHNIARRLDDGMTSDGRRYIVMEYVQGCAITDHADQKALTIAERIELFLQACRAIDFVHNAALLHLDIKPSNLMVNAEGTVKVIDFGLARPEVSEQESGAVNYWSGPYASPEQIEYPSKAGFTADTYSLGAVFYDLMSGHPPFDARSSRDLERMIREETPRPLRDAINRPRLVALESGTYREIDPQRLAEMRGEADLAELRRTLSGDLDRVSQFALRKAPGRRYRSVSDMISDLERVLEGLKPQFARSGDAVYSAVNRARRTPFVWHGIALTCAATIFGTVLPQAFSASEREATEKAAVLNQAADDLLRHLRESLRPELAADPQFRVAVSMVDAALEGGASIPEAKTPWGEVKEEWEKTKEAIRVIQDQAFHK